MFVQASPLHIRTSIVIHWIGLLMYILSVGYLFYFVSCPFDLESFPHSGNSNLQSTFKVEVKVLIDIVLWVAYFLIHSLLARASFKKAIQDKWPAYVFYQRPAFIIVSALKVFLVFAVHQTIPMRVLPNWPEWVHTLGYIQLCVGVVYFILCHLDMKTCDVFGKFASLIKQDFGL